MSETRPLPPDADLDAIYGIEHCDSCHDDLDYGFTEAIETLVARLPDGTLGTYHDSCCGVLRSLASLGVPFVDEYDYRLGHDPKEATT